MKRAVIASITTIILVTVSALLGQPMPSWAAIQLYFIVLIAHNLHVRGER